MGGWVGPNGAGSPPIYGDGSWNDADTFGTNKAMFVEDNTFTTTRSSQQYCNDGWKGSRVVYRHNTYTNCLWANHGTDSPGRWRSQRQYEVYNNTFTISNGLTWPSVIGSRGGTGVVYNNTVTTSGGSTVFSVHDLHSYRPENHSAAYAFSATPFNQCTSGTGTCESGTSTSPGAFASWASGCPNVNNSCLSVWDGNAPTGANTWPGYPALDQPGRGAGDLISGDTPLNQVTGTATWPHQALDPVYAWNNTINGSVVNIVVSDSDPAGVFVLGVDYFNIPKPGYTAYCYPHPLVSGASCGAMASPASPGNVQVH